VQVDAAESASAKVVLEALDVSLSECLVFFWWTTHQKDVDNKNYSEEKLA